MRNVMAQIGAGQLGRGGKAFTKADYVAILTRLSPNVNPLEAHTMMTLEHLRAAIRLQLYDPERADASASASATVSATASAQGGLGAIDSTTHPTTPRASSRAMLGGQ